MKQGGIKWRWKQNGQHWTLTPLSCKHQALISFFYHIDIIHSHKTGPFTHRRRNKLLVNMKQKGRKSRQAKQWSFHKQNHETLFKEILGSKGEELLTVLRLSWWRSASAGGVKVSNSSGSPCSLPALCSGLLLQVVASPVFLSSLSKPQILVFLLSPTQSQSLPFSCSLDCNSELSFPSLTFSCFFFFCPAVTFYLSSILFLCRFFCFSFIGEP